MNEKNRQISEICEHYDAFYAMTLAAAFVSSYDSEDFRKDAGKIIDFIGASFKLEDTFVSVCKSYIFGGMMQIGLIADYNALSAMECDCLDEEDIENLRLYEIKGKVLEEVNRSERRDYFYKRSGGTFNNKEEIKHEMFHHAYDAHMRFEDIRLQAEYGDIASVRQLGLLYMFGIGCTADHDRAKICFRRGAIWGDIAAAAFLANLCSMSGEEKEAYNMSEIFRLEKKYLKDGIIMLPETEEISSELKEFYQCIAFIRQYLTIYAKITEIDIVFADVILNPDIPAKDKYAYICKYKDMTWRNEIRQCGNAHGGNVRNGNVRNEYILSMKTGFIR